MSTQGSVYIKISFQIPGVDVTSINLAAKKSMKMKFSANKIYYTFSLENPKSRNIQNPYRPYRHFNIVNVQQYLLILTGILLAHANTAL